ncbi:PASTA domain-containing protein, partial [Arthrobacter sp. GCM10027362]|uniref:PASTA domain-containing protein n=1 Tax=Arthrobacter sp. GCM10027362 TaxID=3273379 RepID=UPI00362F552A
AAAGPAVLAASRPATPAPEQGEGYAEERAEPDAPAADPDTEYGADALREEAGFHSRQDLDDARRTRRRAWIVTLMVALVLVLGAGAFFLVNVVQENARPQLVSIPAVAGMDQNQAANTIYGADLRPRILQEYSDDVQAGQAIRTDPGTGEQAAVDSEVRIYISQGREFIILPEDLAGRTEGEVRDRLRELGLVPGTSEPANSANLPRGSVVSLDPAPGQQVRTGSTVDLMISNGKVTVPQLLDKSEQDAIKLLEDPAVALPYKVVTVENPVVKPGTVTAQSHDAGSDVDQGTLITITVTVAPEQPSESASPTPSSPPSDRGQDRDRGNDDDQGDNDK